MQKEILFIIEILSGFIPKFVLHNLCAENSRKASDSYLELIPKKHSIVY